MDKTKKKNRGGGCPKGTEHRPSEAKPGVSTGTYRFKPHDKAVRQNPFQMSSREAVDEARKRDRTQHESASPAAAGVSAIPGVQSQPIISLAAASAGCVWSTSAQSSDAATVATRAAAETQPTRSVAAAAGASSAPNTCWGQQ